MSTPRPGWRDGLARLLRLARKELSESLRDRRTVLTLLLMPALLYPILALAFQQLVLSNRADKLPPQYRVAFRNKGEAEYLMGYWTLGLRGLQRRHGPPPDEKGEPQALAKFLDPVPELLPVQADDPARAVSDGEAEVGVRLVPPGKGGELHVLGLEVFYRAGSPAGLEAARYLDALTAEANAQRMMGPLNRLLRRPMEVILLSATEAPDDTPKKSPLVPVLVPLLLVLMTMTGAVYPAIDLTAGERERGTLEVLVAAPIPRLSVLLAKYVAVVTVAMLTAIVNLGMMALVLSVLGLGRALFQDSFTFVVLLQVLGLLLLFAAFFSAVLLTLTSFARSFKEAQAYLIPLILLCLLPGMMALLPGLSLEGPLAVVPLVNIVLLARDLLGGSASAAAAAVVVVVTLLYALGAVALASRVFGTEAVLSNEQSGWADLFARPPRPVPRLGISGALLCLAVMFPIYFVISTGLAQLPMVLEAKLAFTAAAQLALFGGVPMVAAWLARVELVPGFRLWAPPLAAWPVAVVLGISLWPFVAELILLLQQLGISTLSPELKKRAAEAIASWRETPVVVFLVIFALLPAVLEELLFRGLLLEALAGERRRAVAAIVGSAVAFAVFHLLVTDALAIERLPPSLLMGLVLGWLAWRAGSVWPGVLLHALHNGIVVLAGYYKPELVEAGLIGADQDHLPGWALGVAGAGVVIGVLGALVIRRRGAAPQPAE